jgi:hypothetical protein
MCDANRRLFTLLIALVLGVWACTSTTPTPVIPSPVAGALSATPLALPATLAASPDATMAPVATGDVAATQFVEGLSPEQRVAYAAVQTQLPNDPSRWLVAMNETLAAQGSATPTPLPFPVVTEVGQFGVRYRFADPADIERIQTIYERYWDFISFRDGPPPDDLAEALGQHLSPSPNAAFRDGECMFEDVLGKVQVLKQRGLYLRISSPEVLQWGLADKDVWLIANGVDADRIRAEVRSAAMTNGLVEITDLVTGRVIQALSLSIYLTPNFECASSQAAWKLLRDANGVYCGDTWTIISAAINTR